VNGYDEILNHDEIAALTGVVRRSAQVQWLTDNAWRFELNAANAPVIGRWYARMKLAGVELSGLAPGKLPDFAQVR
jgi:hypothetical protein